MQDLHNIIYPIAVIPPVSVSNNTAQVGTVIDLAAVLTPVATSTVPASTNEGGFDGLEFITSIGAFADVDAVFTPLVEDSPDNITFTTVDPSLLLGSVAAASFATANANSCKRIGYIGSQRYVRYTVTPANNSGATVFGVTAVPCFPRSAATDNN